MFIILNSVVQVTGSGIYINPVICLIQLQFTFTWNICGYSKYYAGNKEKQLVI
jgi:hypothetical protein